MSILAQGREVDRHLLDARPERPELGASPKGRGHFRGQETIQRRLDTPGIRIRVQVLTQLDHLVPLHQSVRGKGPDNGRVLHVLHRNVRGRAYKQRHEVCPARVPQHAQTPKDGTKGSVKVTTTGRWVCLRPPRNSRDVVQVSELVDQKRQYAPESEPAPSSKNINEPLTRRRVQRRQRCRLRVHVRIDVTAVSRCSRGCRARGSIGCRHASLDETEASRKEISVRGRQKTRECARDAVHVQQVGEGLKHRTLPAR